MENSVSFVVSKKQRPFVMLDRKMLQTKMSLKARGLLAFMMSFPDEWEFRFDHIVSQHEDGATAVRTAMKELISLGYVKREVNRAADGRVFGTRYIVSEHPQGSEQTLSDQSTEIKENRTSGKPNFGKPAPLINKYCTNKINNIKYNENKGHISEQSSAGKEEPEGKNLFDGTDEPKPSQLKKLKEKGMTLTDSGEAILDPMFERILRIKPEYERGSKRKLILERGREELAGWNRVKNSLTEEDLSVVERFYEQKKGGFGCLTNRRKHNPSTLMNNWASQVELANEYFDSMKVSPIKEQEEPTRWQERLTAMAEGFADEAKQKIARAITLPWAKVPENIRSLLEE